MAITPDRLCSGPRLFPKGRAVFCRSGSARSATNAWKLCNTVKLNDKYKILALHVVIGAAIGIVVLHPVNGMVSWFDSYGDSGNAPSLWPFLTASLGRAFSVKMLPMTAIFAMIGAAIGLGFGLFQNKVIARNRMLGLLGNELAQDLPSVIAQGEGENVEFKSSLRWDSEHSCTNRALEAVVAKTIAGFMNHRGGSLLIGIADNGDIVGLQGDYATLKHKNRDGFERCLTDLVKNRLGGDKCSMVHCVFYEIDGKDICRVIVDASAEAVYCQDGKVPRYYLRTGNGTRELDVREALAHVAARRV